METEIRRRLGILIYGVDDETLQGNTAALLAQQKLRLAVVETFTGGAISHRFAGTGSPSSRRGRAARRGSTARLSGLPRGRVPDAGRGSRPLDRRPGRGSETPVRGRRGSRQLRLFASRRESRTTRGRATRVLARAGGPVANAQPLGGELPMLRERATILAIDLLRKPS